MEGVPFFFSKFVQRMSLFVARSGGAASQQQLPLLKAKRLCIDAVRVPKSAVQRATPYAGGRAAWAGCDLDN